MSKKRAVEPTKQVDDGSNDAPKENVKAERESRRKMMGSMTSNDDPTMMTTGQTAVMTAMISDHQFTPLSWCGNSPGQTEYFNARQSYLMYMVNKMHLERQKSLEVFQRDDPWLDTVVEQVHDMFLSSHDEARLERAEAQVRILLLNDEIIICYNCCDIRSSLASRRRTMIHACRWQKAGDKAGGKKK